MLEYSLSANWIRQYIFPGKGSIPPFTLQRENNYLKGKGYKPHCSVGIADSTPWIRTGPFSFLFNNPHQCAHSHSLSHRQLSSFSLQEQVSNPQRPLLELTPSFFMKHLFLYYKRVIPYQINFLSLFLHYGDSLILT